MAREEATNEQIQREILETDLAERKLRLGQTKKQMADYEDAERRRHSGNKLRQAELDASRNNHHALIRQCRHKAGGSPTNVLRGGGKFAHSLITRAVMPDGVTQFLQCSRCRLKMYTPEKKNRQLWFKTFDTEKAYFDKLVETSVEDGIEHNVMRGPTFLFQKDGVPFIPERV